jgi:hypothetical protein
MSGSLRFSVFRLLTDCVYRLHSTGATPNNHRQQRTYPTTATIDTIDSERPVYTNKGNNKITELRTILPHGEKYKHSLSCQDERENGFNKAYPYRNQAQVQYINLA